MIDKVFCSSLLAVDAERFSAATHLEKLSTQRLISRLMADSLFVVREDYPDSVHAVDWIDGGDGGFLIVQGDVRSAFRVQGEVRRLLDQENMLRLPERRLVLRFAVHFGFIHSWKDATGTKFTGDAIVESERLLSGMNRSYQAVCSEAYVHHLTSTCGVRSTAFQDLAPVVDKHGNTHGLSAIIE